MGNSCSVLEKLFILAACVSYKIPKKIFQSSLNLMSIYDETQFFTCIMKNWE